MKSKATWWLLAAVVVIGAGGCGSAVKPRIAVLLPDMCNTPDGMVLGPDGFIYLSCPNFNDPSYAPRIVRLSPDGQLIDVGELPGHPETGKAGPLGLDFGPDGHLYIADNQSLWGFNNHKSRLLRIRMNQGRPEGVEVLVTGFIQANAVACHEDSVYVTETSLDLSADPMPSGVYRFRLSEFQGEPIDLTRTAAGHLVVKFYTDNPDWRIGANGLGFDEQGNMYVCNFGEASLLRFGFGPDGNVVSHEVVARGQGMESTDGLKVHPRTGAVYVADYVGNAVHKVNPRTGQVTTLWKNENNSGGIGGLLDRPSEVCLRGNWIYVANIDLPGQGNEYDAPHTLSVLPLR